MAHKQYVDIVKKYEPHKKSPLENINQKNKTILSEVIGKNIEIKSSYAPSKRKYYVNDIEDIFVESSSGKLIPGYKLVNKKLSNSQQITVNAPYVEIETKMNEDKKTLILKYEQEINFERGFKHLHKPTQPPLKIYIKILDE